MQNNHKPIHQKIGVPKPGDLILIRVMIFGACLILAHFIGWFFDPAHRGHELLFWVLAISFGYKILHFLYEWHYLASMKETKTPVSSRQWTVDMLTTYVPGEPYEMVVKTLEAMKAVTYPHTTYLCDEGNDPYLKEVCKKLGVIHVYRGPDKTDAKAGNINYALERYARGEICIILDPDHVPVPEFIDRVIPYFENPQIGFVQCIQGYSNFGESFVARAAAEQTFLFYGPLMMGMHRRGTVQAIGANCTFRRTALDGIGGHAAGLCEDMHTSMRLHAAGWKSVYVPELLTRGRVPTTLSAYYQQQLKWARGSFDLLFKVYPRLFSTWTPQQRMHYLLTPMYFLYGLIGLIDIGVPIVSLMSFEVPLTIEFQSFVFRILPLILAVFVIRHFAQHFVLDEYERGSHYRGGLLRVGTWWVYLLGFVYAVLGKKVPYIPTSKDDVRQNDWKGSIPNLMAIGVSIFAIVYGLRNDLTPFSLIMAGFAGLNILLLGIVVLAGQQKLRDEIAQVFTSNVRASLMGASLKFRQNIVYRLFRHHTVAAGLILLGLGITFSGRPDTYRGFDPDKEGYPKNKMAGPVDAEEPFWKKSKRSEGTKAQQSPYLFEGYKISLPDSNFLDRIEAILLQKIEPRKYLLIRLSLPAPAEMPPAVWELLSGQIDLASELMRDYKKPVVLCIEIDAAEPDSISAGFQHVARRFKQRSGTNVSFAWPFRLGNQNRFPGPDYVDMVFVEQSNALTGYFPAQLAGAGFDRPVILALGKNAQAAPLRKVVEPFEEAGIDVFGTAQWRQPPLQFGKNVTGDSIPSTFAQVEKPKDKLPEKENPAAGLVYNKECGQYQWIVEGAPFYVKGVFYNPEQDGRDRGRPLTRRQLEQDFKLIKDMGANAISRNAMTIYDHNIISVAQQEGLRIVYRFPMAPDIDYLNDTHTVNKMKARVLQWVNRHKMHQGIIAWSLGNDTWHKLGYYFHQPYLSEVRMAYVAMIEQITAEIKKSDPGRPVIVSMGGGSDLAGALDDFYHAAPSLDIMSISAYSTDEYAPARNLIQQRYPGRPFLVDEFGEKASPQRHDLRPGQENSFEKARLYSTIWDRQIAVNKRENLGGIAYCWRDRAETTAVFSGLTDYKGRLKPAYYALKQSWTGKLQTLALNDFRLHWKQTLMTEHDYYHEFTVVSPFASDASLTYEWYWCDESRFGRRDHILIDRTAPLASEKEKVMRVWRRDVADRIFTKENGSRLYIKDSNIRGNPSRIYLHLSDKTGNVVVASCPIY